MLQVLGALVTLGLIGLSLVIGVRLLRLAARTGGPERWLGLYFVAYGFVATSLSVATYVGWSAPEAALSDGATRVLNGRFFALSTLGMACLLVFTWRTFRPGSRSALAAVAGTTSLLVAAAVALGADEGFEVRVLNGPAYWIHFAAIRSRACGTGGSPAPPSAGSPQPAAPSSRSWCRSRAASASRSRL